MRCCSTIWWAAISAGVMLPSVAEAQRVRFPTPVESTPVQQSPTSFANTQVAPPASGLPYNASPGYGSAAPTYGGSTTPGYGSVSPSYGSVAPSYGGATTYPPGSTSTMTSPPVTPPVSPPAAWDPYSTGAYGGSPSTSPGVTYPPNVPYGYGSTAPGTVMPPANGGYGAPGYGAPGYGAPGYAVPPNGGVGYMGAAPQSTNPYGSSNAPFGWQSGQYVYQTPDGQVTTFQRLMQNVGFEYTWLAQIDDESPKRFGMNRLELWTTFGFPFFYNTESPLLVTPGFAFNWLDGPVTLSPKFPDLPPRLYDAYLDTAWQPKVSQWFSGDLGLRVGVYSDFDRVVDDSVRFQGRALGVMQFTPSVSLSLGVWYLDRLNIKLLPAGGLIWTPTPDTNFRLVFPNPKLAHRFSTVGTAEWWWYFAGEYGGGSWTGTRLIGGDRFDYNDIRVSFGLEWVSPRGLHGHMEIGYVFDREIIYESQMPPSFKADDTIMVRAGLDF